ncbi:MAG: PEP-CTERM sorting domain-containing protein [Planctomycetia bacterium]|nr:PEP-CTERM sorting domain-containing protein [Planctomycetia bacterium]
MFTNRILKSHSISLSLFSIAAVSTMMFGGVASMVRASTVDIQFLGAPTLSAAKSYNGQQGAYTGDAVASPTWNVLGWGSGTYSNLLASNDATTNVGVSYNSSGPYDDSTTPSNGLLTGYIYASNNTTNTVTLTGLTASGNYQLYLYGQDGGFSAAGADYSITTGSGSPAVGSNAQTLNSLNITGNTGTFQENANYVIFNVTADAAGTLVINYTAPTGGGGSEGDINGLQITTVPEPSSLGLILLGCMGLMIGRKYTTRRSA